MITVKNSATFHSSHKKNYFGKMCKSVGYSDLKRENFSEEIVCYNKWNKTKMCLFWVLICGLQMLSMAF